jgi:hypothetical protein
MRRSFIAGLWVAAALGSAQAQIAYSVLDTSQFIKGRAIGDVVSLENSFEARLDGAFSYDPPFQQAGIQYLEPGSSSTLLFAFTQGDYASALTATGFTLAGNLSGGARWGANAGATGSGTGQAYITFSVQTAGLYNLRGSVGVTSQADGTSQGSAKIQLIGVYDVINPFFVAPDLQVANNGVQTLSLDNVFLDSAANGYAYFVDADWSLDVGQTAGGLAGTATANSELMFSLYLVGTDPVTLVPEPGPWGFFATGLAALMARRRRPAQPLRDPSEGPGQSS